MECLRCGAYRNNRPHYGRHRLGYIGNLHVLFAVAIGGSWAKERAGGAFSALIAFLLINRITGAIFGVSTEMLADPTATVQSLFGADMIVSDYFTEVLGASALNMGVFVGIISGFLGASLFNKYYNFNKLPQALAFFNGKRFVPFVVIGGSVVTALILSIIWPFAQGVLNGFGQWIATSQDTAPILAPFVFGAGRAFIITIWSSPYVNHPNELHRIRWNV